MGSKIPDTAMVFAAGLGKRMQPLTLTKPKPLIEVAGRTMLDRTLDHLVMAGVKRAIVNTHYLAEQISEHLAKRRKNIDIIISYEPQLLETGGGLKNAQQHLGREPIYVINSDILWIDGGRESALIRLAKMWDKNKMNVLLLLAETQKAVGYDGSGDFDIGLDGALKRSGKKPYVFTGVQMLDPDIVSGASEIAFSLNRYYFDNPQAYGLVHNGEWLHIGTPQGLAQAEKYLDTH